MISIGVDIGGTFTDVFAFDWVDSRHLVLKVPTTTGALAEGITAGVRQVLAAFNRDAADVDRFVHGTTVATNAVLEEAGASVALLTTAGFEDVLEIGRLNRTQMYDLMLDPEVPVFLAPRERRYGVDERVGADGEIVRPLDLQQVERLARELVDSRTAEAVAVSLLHAYAYPEHERQVREVFATLDSSIPVSISSDVDPMFREYERTVVTAFDAYVRPAVGLYLRDLIAQLNAIGLRGPIQVMHSRGGITGADYVVERPVSLLLSGPAAGAIGGAFAARQSGIGDVITIDVGGTSADVTLIEKGRPLVTSEGQIGTYPVRLPMVDTTTVGAGGGSIAWVDAAGRARVGPRSAGAVPGPACYGRGGTDATVTDASVVLGYLDCDYFAGGTLKLDYDASVRVVEHFGEPLGLSLYEAAAGIHRIVNSTMADAIRRVSIKRGYDPREFALVLLGGAGALHGGRLASELGIGTAVVPTVPGVLSAFGLLVADIEHSESAAALLPALAESDARLRDIASALLDAVGVKMAAERVGQLPLVTSHLAEMRYVGQSYSLEVPFAGPLDDPIAAGCREEFDSRHQRVYGHSSPLAAVEFVAWRVVQTCQLRQPRMLRPERTSSRSTTTRMAYFDDLGELTATPVVHRSTLAVGEQLEGPVIVEQDDTTLVVYPGDTAKVDDSGNILMAIGRHW